MGSCLMMLTAILSAGPMTASDVPTAAQTKTVAATSKPKRTAAGWRTAVHDALRQEATSQGAAHERALRQLLAMYEDLQADAPLGEVQRRELRGLVRNRLARSNRALRTQLAKSAAESEATGSAVADTLKLLQGDPNILAQRPAAQGQAAPPQAAAGPPAAPQPAASTPAQNNAQELVDLIQKTIAPDTWDIRGGPGVIRYFENKQSLVILQTDEVHGQLEELIRDLRRDE
jgi:hypothetical protein